jgi:delta-aminolevulinic acid dehydratase/porphobilinogen synthase
MGLGGKVDKVKPPVRAVRNYPMIDSALLACVCGHTLNRHAQVGMNINAPYECMDCKCKRLRKDLQLIHVDKLPKRDNG